MVIYQAKNKINGKVYVGQTIGNLDRRKSDHLSSVKSIRYDSYFHNAIRKYGKDNFVWEIIEECNTIEELNEREKYWIEILDSISPNGYNLMSGGRNSMHHEKTKVEMSEIRKGKYCGKKHPRYGKKHTKETLKKMSESKQGENHPMFGKNHTRKSLKKMREAAQGENHPMYGKTGKDNPNYGKTHTEETLKKMSEAQQGESNPRAKLTEADVLDIRKWYKEGMSYKEISEIKSVTQENVGCIVKYKTWKHVV